MRIIEKPVKELLPYAKNPRRNDKAVDAVAASIREFGFKVPVIVDTQGVIVAGHTRVKAAMKLGLTTLPCVVADDLTPDQVKAFRLADNKTAELAEWDLALLGDELTELDLDMAQFGFDDACVNSSDLEEDDFDIGAAISSEPITKFGDVWLLGTHRLVCGDATSMDDMRRLMGDDLADLIITDPPYNVDYEGATKERLKIANDKMSSDHFRTFLTAAFNNLFISSRQGASVYVFHSDSEGYNFRGAFCDAGFKLAQSCVWVKNAMVIGRQDYQWQHEPILCGEHEDGTDAWEPVLYGWNPTARHHWHSDRRQKTVWCFDKPLRSAEHPTMKPVKLVAYPMMNSSKQGDIVLDTFGGSGSTLIAAEQTGRACRMMELDPVYCDVIIRRWEALTGRKAERIKQAV